MNNPFLIATVPHEGGPFSAEIDESAPIRIYSNGAVFDDIYGGLREFLEPDRLREVLSFISSKPRVRVKANSVGRYHAVVDEQLFARLPATGDADHWEHVHSGKRFMIGACQPRNVDRSKITADAMLKVARREHK